MAEQEYKALHFKPDSISPQGKPKVFFCCHEADFSTFFEPVMEEIRAILPNVTFWYYDPAEGIPSGEEFLADLSQMNLYVIPVTYRFIYQDTPARTVEFQYAINHHIPVLPLMQEPDLEEEFNRVCGDLQLLDKYASAKDPTSLPYEEKLKKYLQSVLISDELAQQIRNAFDAYVFLSYRKKDRKYAQEIMNLIHDNEYCRDVAIWYDEFLTPGENFNESIQKVLAKSALFALVVTPNLLEEENYVAKHEYPEATKTDKTIAPIQAKETDLNELETMFPGIKTCLSEEEVRNHFHELFHDVALRENYNDPKHEFFMGLAYLSGIDVEVNHERALELITAAADANLPEAYEKLVSMYQNGEGVERDYHAAIEWQQKYVDYLKVVFDKTPNKDNLVKLHTALNQLGDYQFDVADLAGAKKSYADSVIFANKLDIIESFCSSILSSDYLKLGTVSEEEGNANEAANWYGKAIDVLTGTSRSSHQFLKSVSRLLNLLIECGNYSVGKEACMHLLDLERDFNRDSVIKKVETNQLYVLVYGCLGRISQKKRQFGEAKDWNLKAIRILEELFEEHESTALKLDLIRYYLRMGDVNDEEQNYSEAREWYLKSLDIVTSIAEETKSVEWFKNQDIIYDHLGKNYELEGNLIEAKKMQLKALEFNKIFVKKIGSMESFEILLNNYLRLGEISADDGNYSEAREWYFKALEISKKLAGEAETPNHLYYMTLVYNYLGKNSEAEGNLIEAKEWILKALEICEKRSVNTFFAEPHHSLQLMYNLLGTICVAEGNYLEAKEWCQKSLNSIKKLEKEDNIDVLEEQALSYSTLGVCGFYEGHYIEAKEWCRKSLEIREKLAEETGTAESFRNLSVGYTNMGAISEAEGNFSEANDWYQKANDINAN